MWPPEGGALFFFSSLFPPSGAGTIILDQGIENGSVARLNDLELMMIQVTIFHLLFLKAKPSLIHYFETTNI